MNLAGLFREDHVQSCLLFFLYFVSFDYDCWIIRHDVLFSLYSLTVATSPAMELAGHCRLDIERRAQGYKKAAASPFVDFFLKFNFASS